MIKRIGVELPSGSERKKYPVGTLFFIDRPSSVRLTGKHTDVYADTDKPLIRFFDNLQHHYVVYLYSFDPAIQNDEEKVAELAETIYLLIKAGEGESE